MIKEKVRVLEYSLHIFTFKYLYGWNIKYINNV